MHRLSTDILQSFRLRFWREPREGTPGEWRGSVWHEQQAPGEEAIAVINPEEAFALVRRALQQSTARHADGSTQHREDASRPYRSSATVK
jgi:hypothetical protein